jgi:hypothetical protein
MGSNLESSRSGEKRQNEQPATRVVEETRSLINTLEMTMSIEEVLSNSLETIINQDSTLENFVSNYPEHEKELVDLLSLAYALKALDQMSPRAMFVENACQRLVSRLPDRNVAYHKQIRPIRRKRNIKLNFRRRLNIFQVAILLVLMLVVLTGGSAFAANSAVPGDIFYVVDLAFERFHLNFAFSNETAARIRLRIADERLDEAEKVLLYGDVRNGTAALEGYENEIVAVTKLVGSKTGVDRDQLNEMLEIALLRHKSILKDLINKFPEQAWSGIHRALVASSKSKVEKTMGPPVDIVTRKPEDNNKDKSKDKTKGKPDHVGTPPGKP